MTPDLMPGVVPPCVSMETKNNQHTERRTAIAVGTGLVKARSKWGTVELLACPVTLRPHTEQMVSALPGYEDWWRALDWVWRGLMAREMSRVTQVMAANLKLRPPN